MKTTIILALAAILQTSCTVPAPIGNANPLDRAEFPDILSPHLVHTVPVSIPTTPIPIPPVIDPRPPVITAPIPTCPIVYIVD